MNSVRMHIRRRLGIPLLAMGLLVAGTQVAAAQQPPKNFVMHEAPKAVSAISFEDQQGQARSLADFRGKVVLVNIWATWCAPCRREMPALDRLQAALGDAEFVVAAVSIDRAGIEVVRKFYADVAVRHLAIYIDRAGKVARELGTFGLPATLLIDREGRELGRLVGPAEWDSPEIVEFLKRVVSQKTGATQRMNRSKHTDARSMSTICARARHAENPITRKSMNQQRSTI